MQWHSVAVGPSELFPAANNEDDADVEPACTPFETNQNFLMRTLIQAANDQRSHESGSSTPEHAHAPEQVGQLPPNPQSEMPFLFVPWSTIAQGMGIPVAHEELTADFSVMFRHAIGILSTDDLRTFQSQHGAVFDRIPTQTEPLILGAIYAVHPWTDHWETLLWHMAQHYTFWLQAPLEPPPAKSKSIVS